MNFSLSSLLILLLPLTARAFPNGAGGCGSGESAATPRHGTARGDLSAGGYSVNLTPNGNDISVTLTGSNSFRGFLFRMEGVEINSFSNGIAQPAAACSAPAIGVTHTSNNEKTSATASFETSGPGTYELEVTVVQTFSRTFYERFSVTIIQLTPPPTAAPTLPPTIAPTTAPTPAPTVPPTASPTLAPTLPPTAPPTLAPTAAPTPPPSPPIATGPTSSPTPEPTPQPTIPQKKSVPPDSKDETNKLFAEVEVRGGLTRGRKQRRLKGRA